MSLSFSFRVFHRAVSAVTNERDFCGSWRGFESENSTTHVQWNWWCSKDMTSA